LARLASVLAIWLLLLTASAVFMASGGIRINLSGSLPLGLYRLTSSELERGSLVAVCPELSNPAVRVARERGYLEPVWFTCDGGMAALLKQILALPGDWVDVSPDGIRVNGREIENSARLAVDGAGRPLPPLPVSGEVPAGHVWLFSGHAPESFDSRYFGPVSHAAIRGTATPIWNRSH